MAVIGTVYLLHFEPAYRHAQHYLGWAVDAHDRIDKHLAGDGANLVRVAIGAGCHVELVRTWEGVDRNFERRIKKSGTLKRVCPRCRPAHLERKRTLQRRRQTKMSEYMTCGYRLRQRTTEAQFEKMDLAVREATAGALSLNVAQYPAVTGCAEQIWCVGSALLPTLGVNRLRELEAAARAVIEPALAAAGIEVQS